MGALKSDAALSADEIAFEAEEAGVCLSVTVNGATKRHVILRARHSGGQSPRDARVFDQLCKIIEGRPLQEAADHGAIYTAEALPGDCATVPGIGTPHNAGPPFRLAERLMRKIHALARERFHVEDRENTWYSQPRSEWLAMNEAAQAAQVKPIVADSLRRQGLSENDAWICRIERGTRITIAFSNQVSYAQKPKLLMELERRLRRETGDPLELFMDEMKDGNKIRRL